MDYSEQLKTKEWKRKRLEVLIRDKHTCQICGYIGKNVNIHHKKYNGNAWDADIDDLITLCKRCHYTIHRPELSDKKFDEMRLGNLIHKYYGK